VGYKCFGGQGRQYDPLKQWYPTTSLHGVIIQMTIT